VTAPKADARAEHARLLARVAELEADKAKMVRALDLAYDAIDHRKTVVRATLVAARGGRP